MPFRLPLALCLTLALCTTPTLAAKGNRARTTTPLESFQYVVKQLDLPADRQGTADQILADLQKKFDDLKQQSKSAKDADTKKSLKTKYKDALVQARTEIEQLLTPEQADHFHKLLAQERTDRKAQEQEQKARHHKDRPAATQPTEK